MDFGPTAPIEIREDEELSRNSCDLTRLSVSQFRRALQDMSTSGAPEESIGAALVTYAKYHLKGLDNKQQQLTQKMRQKQALLLDEIESLIPCKKGAVTTSFLFSMLRLARDFSASVAGLEQRISMQLEDATLNDILIPSRTNWLFFDLDLVHRLALQFFQNSTADENSKAKVAALLDKYLAKVAVDPSLDKFKFISLAEVAPASARPDYDRLYRAINVFLKAHPDCSENDKNEICKTLDLAMLSRKACLHAEKNDNLPVRVVLQVMYMEQLRLKATVDGSAISRNESMQQNRPSPQNEAFSRTATERNSKNNALTFVCKRLSKFNPFRGTVNRQESTNKRQRH